MKILTLLFFMSFQFLPIMANDINTVNEVDKDLEALNVNLDEYLDYDNKLILMSELSDEYLVFYFYNKDERFDYNKIDLELGGTNSKDSLDDLELIHYEFDIDYIATSSDGFVDKLIIDFDIPGFSYRKYNVRQFTYGDGTYSYIIGDSYVFTTNDVGELEYEVNKYDYITFDDIVLHDYFIDTGDFWDGFFNDDEAKRVYFYGFSFGEYDSKRFSLDSLEKIEFSFYEYDFKGIFYPENDFILAGSTLINPKQEWREWDFDEEYYLKDDYWGSQFRGQTCTFDSIYSNEKYFSRYEVTGRTFEEISPGAFFLKHKNSWNSIMKYDSLETEVKGEKLKKSLLDDYLGMDYVICLNSYDAILDVNSTVSFTPSTDYPKIRTDINYFAKYEYLSRFGIDASSYLSNTDINYALYGAATKAESKAIKNAQILKLTFRNVLGNEYDVNVIVKPTNSSTGGFLKYNNPEDFAKNYLLFYLICQSVLFVVVLIYLIYVLYKYFRSARIEANTRKLNKSMNKLVDMQLKDSKNKKNSKK